MDRKSNAFSAMANEPEKVLTTLSTGIDVNLETTATVACTLIDSGKVDEGLSSNPDGITESLSIDQSSVTVSASAEPTHKTYDILALDASVGDVELLQNSGSSENSGSGPFMGFSFDDLNDKSLLTSFKTDPDFAPNYHFVTSV